MKKNKFSFNDIRIIFRKQMPLSFININFLVRISIPFSTFFQLYFTPWEENI